MVESDCLIASGSEFQGWTTRWEKKFDLNASLLELFKSPRAGVATLVSFDTTVAWRVEWLCLSAERLKNVFAFTLSIPFSNLKVWSISPLTRRSWDIGIVLHVHYVILTFLWEDSPIILLSFLIYWKVQICRFKSLFTALER